MSERISIVYVTSSKHKRDENVEFANVRRLSNGVLVRDLFDFDIRTVPIKELLEINLTAMVHAEVVSAYTQLRIPCVVEHAGLIFDDFRDQSYPGGLTKPMWNALGPRFVEETHSADRKATARAVVGYCDGQTVHTFVGETSGRIASTARGKREFYWDTVFIPNQPNGEPGNKTYAEIADDPALGLGHKMTVSQSATAMLKFLEFRLTSGLPRLWHGVAP